MDFATSHYIQLIIAMLGGIALFSAAYTLPQRWIIWVLVLLIPFQLIQSRFGSINMVLTYMIFVALYARGSIRRFPLLGIVMAIMFVYGLSLSQVIRATFFQNIIYIISTFSNFLMFYIIYNHVRNSRDIRDMWRLLAALNMLVIFYCVFEMVAGKTGVRVLGIQELEVRSQRSEDGHLTGPFRAIAMTAEYLALQALLSMYALINQTAKRGRLFWAGMVVANLGLLIATGSRGGVISLAAALVVFVYLFRAQLGTRRLVIWGGAGAVLFALSSFVIVNYTSYNVLFDRLEKTEVKGVIPDTRTGWVDLWPRIIEKPVIGHGPRMRFDNEELIRHPDFRPMPYPHSAYLFLIFTIGFLGLFVYIWFFAAIALQYLRAGKADIEDRFIKGLPYLGFVLLFLSAVSELRMEMFRYILHAYQQYIFMLLATFLAFAHIVRNESRSRPDGVETGAGTDVQPSAPQRILRYKGGTR